MPGDSGVVFITLSDETRIANVVVWPKLVQVFRREIMGARLLLVEGKVQRSPEGVIHLMVHRVIDRVRPTVERGDDVVLVGHSYGGFVTRHIAAFTEQELDELEKLIREKAAEKVEADAAVIARG